MKNFRWVPQVTAAAMLLVIEDGGATHEMVIERMDIYLTEEGHPEIFEIHGQGVTLAGEIPSEARVDYGEHFDRSVRGEFAAHAMTWG